MVCFKLVIEVMEPLFLDLPGMVIVLTGRVFDVVATFVEVAPSTHYIQDGE